MPDIKLFSVNRELFPRSQECFADRLICGHLNKAKFKPDIQQYLHNRKIGLSKTKSLARASRCLCHQITHPNSSKKKLNMIYCEIGERKKIAATLQKIAINVKENDKFCSHKTKEFKEQDENNTLFVSKTIKKITRF